MAAALAPLDALFTRTQQRLLALLFAAPGEHSLGALVRRSGGGSGAIRREVERLLGAGLVRERRVANQRLIAADESSPCYAALQVLSGTAVQPVVPRRNPVRPSAALIAQRGALLKALARHGLTNPRVFGSVARGSDTAASDLDLLVDTAPRTSLLDLAKAQRAVEEALSARVDLVTIDDLPEDWRGAVLAEAVPL